MRKEASTFYHVNYRNSEVSLSDSHVVSVNAVFLCRKIDSYFYIFSNVRIDSTRFMRTKGSKTFVKKQGIKIVL